MKKILFSCLLVLATATPAFAQTEVANDSVKRLPDKVPAIQEAGRQAERTNQNDFILPDRVEPVSTFAKPSEENSTFRIHTPEFLHTPWPTPRLGTGGNPFANDYNQYDIFLLTPDSYLNTYSTFNTYPTIGTFIEAGGSYTYRLSERLDITGGLYATKYSMPSFVHGLQLDAGINAALGFRINERLRIRLIGQYSLYGQQNSTRGYLTPLAPQSYYGAIMELKVTDWLEVHGGMERIFDPIRGKWKTIPVVYPVINFKKK